MKPSKCPHCGGELEFERRAPIARLREVFDRCLTSMNLARGEEPLDFGVFVQLCEAASYALGYRDGKETVRQWLIWRGSRDEDFLDRLERSFDPSVRRDTRAT